jgi:hypothetical protein
MSNPSPSPNDDHCDEAMPDGRTPFRFGRFFFIEDLPVI